MSSAGEASEKKEDDGADKTSLYSYSQLSKEGIAIDEEQESEKDESTSLLKYFELLAYAGGLWYVITQFIMGPFARLLTNDQLI
jgi:hypothetical protein